MKVVFILVSLLVCNFSLNFQQRSSEAALKQRVLAYYSSFSNGRYDRMWNMSSRRLQEGNDNNKKEYVDNLRTAGPVSVKVNIKRIEITGQQATVYLLLSLRSNKKGMWVTEEQSNTWVLEKGLWRFDSQISESN